MPPSARPSTRTSPSRSSIRSRTSRRPRWPSLLAVGDRRIGQPDPVVGHGEQDRVVVAVLHAAHVHPHLLGVGVAAHVRQRLLGGAVEHGGVLGLQPRERVGGDGHLGPRLAQPDGQVVDGRAEAGAAQVGRVDVDHQPAQRRDGVLHRRREPVHDGAALLGDGRTERREGVAHPREVLDRAVVHVPGDRPPLPVGRGEGPSP